MTRSLEMSSGGQVVRGQSRYQNGGAGHKQSRLELLQADYQKKLRKEKEEKLLHLYEENQQRTLDRINNPQTKTGLNRGGSVREFFKERRALEAQGKGGVPSIHQHYSQFQKSPTGSAKTYHSSMSNASTSTYKSAGSYSSGYGNSRSAPQGYRNSAGRDRAKPLAPIEHRSSPGSPQTDHSTRRAPVPPIQKPRLYQRKPTRRKPEEDVNDNRIHQGQNGGYSGYESDGSPSPPQNHKIPVRQQQQRQPVRRESTNSRSSGQNSPQKLTDFQKWQLEQNKAREERLQRNKQRHQPNSGGSDRSEGDEQDSGVDLNDEIRRKQEEVEARLHSEQAELHRIQQHRQQKEEKERQQRARQERAERERQRRLEEQRERQRQAEEERQRLQEERRQAEERRLEEQERRRASQASQHSRTYRQTEDDYDTTPRTRKQERKPPAKPQRTQRRERRRTPSPVKHDEDVFVPGPSVDFYADAANDSEAYGGHIDMAPCKVCGRRFAKERLAKHQNACKAVAKPRKVFDPVKMRIAGTEQAKYVNSKQFKKQQPPSKKSNWRAQHKSFIESIRYAKKMTEYEASGGKLSDLPPPPPSDTSDYVQCPHCSRRFNASVAERHIPKCVNIRAKPRPPPNRRR